MRSGFLGRRVIQFHPTLTCNLRCRHCYSGSGPEIRGELAPARVLPFFAAMREEGYETVSFSGGEPLLYRHFLVLVDALAAMGYRINVTTNGLLLKGRLLEALVPRIGLVAVSVDGPPALHDRLRARRGAFARAESALDRLRAAGLPFGLVHTVTRPSIPHLPWLADFAHAKGAALLQLHPLDPTGRGGEIETEFGLDEEARARLFLLGRLFEDRLPDSIAVQVDLHPRAALCAQARDYRLLEPVHAAGLAPGTKLSEVVNPLVITERGEAVPFVYGLASDFTLALTGGDWRRDLEDFRRRGAVRLRRFLGTRFAELERSEVRFVDWYAHLARAAGEEAAGPTAVGRSGGSAIPIARSTASSVEQPEQEAEYEAHQDRGGDRDVDAHAVALDDDVSRQPAETELAEKRPQQTDDDQQQTEEDEELRHHLPPLAAVSSRAVNQPFSQARWSMLSKGWGLAVGGSPARKASRPATKAS